MSKHLTGRQADDFASAAERCATHINEVFTAAVIAPPRTMEQWIARREVAQESLRAVLNDLADLAEAALGPDDRFSQLRSTRPTAGPFPAG